jgi:hypothetical protein
MQIDHINEKQCRHEGCTCIVQLDQEFCSGHCRNATDNTPLREGPRRNCECGHEQCEDSKN